MPSRRRLTSRDFLRIHLPKSLLDGLSLRIDAQIVGNHENGEQRYDDHEAAMHQTFICRHLAISTPAEVYS